MDAKLIIALLIAINCYASCGAALRRTPKVYNALITTDENLTASRAYPVIQPTIHETGVAHYPFGPYNPYGFYGHPLVRFGQPIAPGLVTRQQLPYAPPQQQFPPQLMPQHGHPQPQPFPGYPLPQTPPTAPAEQPQPQPQAQPNPDAPAPAEQQQPVKPPTSLPAESAPTYMPIEENRPKQMPNDKLPIPLNEYGLPPALIPLQQFPTRNGNPVHLPPYPYNQYPLIYDPITGYREQYLPPYEYFPSHTYAVGPSPPRRPYHTQPTAPPTAGPPTTTPFAVEDAPVQQEEEQEQQSTPPATETTVVDFESIKNVSKSKNHAVPDVPPPPIPSGAKAEQS